MTPAVLSASTLMADPIVGRDGEKLGTLKEIMIDLSDGSVAYAVLARGGFGGMGQKLFAVPWAMLTVDGDNHQLSLDADEQLLDDSPGFDPENWPSFSDATWRETVDRHFGLTP
ncbi:MAG TPA: PRC-barrel domain-containing protein [Acidimicrobiia bacterium]|nr:PRC-barrel domain-containing protein [Acidimicrobiia bacterium]